MCNESLQSDDWVLFIQMIVQENHIAFCGDLWGQECWKSGQYINHEI